MKLKRLNTSDTQSEWKVLQITVLIKCHVDTFTANTNSPASYEINGVLLNIKKSDRRQNEDQLWTEATKPQHAAPMGTLEYSIVRDHSNHFIHGDLMPYS